MITKDRKLEIIKAFDTRISEYLELAWQEIISESTTTEEEFEWLYEEAYTIAKTKEVSSC